MHNQPTRGARSSQLGQAVGRPRTSHRTSSRALISQRCWLFSMAQDRASDPSSPPPHPLTPQQRNTQLRPCGPVYGRRSSSRGRRRRRGRRKREEGKRRSTTTIIICNTGRRRAEGNARVHEAVRSHTAGWSPKSSVVLTPGVGEARERSDCRE